MPSRVVLLLPVGALVTVLTLLAVALFFESHNTSRDTSHPQRVDAAQAGPTSTTPRFEPGSNVCQSVLHRPDPGEPRHFPDIYTQQRQVLGLTIVATARVQPEALDVAEQTILRVFEHNNLAEPLAAEGAYVVVADRTQGVLDLPEFGCLAKEVGPDFFTHVCGVADRADYPVATVNELDLLGRPAGPCGGLNILYHEIGHLVQGWTLDPADYFDIKLMYQAAKDAGKYVRDYASTNPNEYFAEATQAYFYAQSRDGSLDREWLKDYDPDIYALLERIYGE